MARQVGRLLRRSPGRGMDGEARGVAGGLPGRTPHSERGDRGSIAFSELTEDARIQRAPCVRDRLRQGSSLKAPALVVELGAQPWSRISRTGE